MICDGGGQNPFEIAGIMNTTTSPNPQKIVRFCGCDGVLNVCERVGTWIPTNERKQLYFEGICGGGGLTSIAFVGTWTTASYEIPGFSFDRGLRQSPQSLR